jgi:hypothetical protein
MDNGLGLITGMIGVGALKSIPTEVGNERSFQFQEAGGIAFGNGTILNVARIDFVSGKNALRNRGFDS